MEYDIKLNIETDNDNTYFSLIISIKSYNFIANYIYFNLENNDNEFYEQLLNNKICKSKYVYGKHGSIIYGNGDNTVTFSNHSYVNGMNKDNIMNITIPLFVINNQIKKFLKLYNIKVLN